MIALIVGACYAELATMMPKAGGAYIRAKPGLGPFFGFFAGWMSSFAHIIACSLYAAAFGSFARTLLSSVSGRAFSSLVEPSISGRLRKRKHYTVMMIVGTILFYDRAFVIAGSALSPI